MWACLKLEWEHIKVSNKAIAMSNDEAVISLHLNLPQPAHRDPNTDTKTAVYHVVLGVLILSVVFLCVWASTVQL